MLCQPPGAQTTLARTVTQGSRTAGKEFREILLAGQCLHLGHAPAWFISKKKQRAAAQRMALPVEPVLHHIGAVQGSAVHHGCTVQAVLSSALLFFSRCTAHLQLSVCWREAPSPKGD